MQGLIVGAFLVIFVASAISALGGLIWGWVIGVELPLVRWLLGATVAEVVPVVVGFARGTFSLALSGGVTKTYKTQKKIDKFMRDFISKGSVVDIFSGQLSWVSGNRAIRDMMIKKAHGQRVMVFLPQKNAIAEELEKGGVQIVDYSGFTPDDLGVRFTLLNRGTPGSQELAVGEGNPPEHRITTYTDTRSPQIVAAYGGLVRLLEERKS